VLSDSDIQRTIDRLQGAFRDNRQSHQQFRRKDAPLFSPFEALSPGENALSGLLKYLFDENEGHGQGSDFLKQFLKLIDCDWPVDRSHIQTEHHTADGRRIDVLISLGDGRRIAIENKAFGAMEQANQCQDYCRELQRLSIAGGSPGQWLLVFLTPDETPPETCGEDFGLEIGKRIRLLRWDTLANELITECKSLWPFLTSLQRYVSERINGKTPLHTEKKTMINKLLEAENIDVTVEIIVLIRDLRQELLKRFKNAMVERIHEAFGKYWEADILFEGHTVPDLDLVYSGIYFFKPEWKGKFAIGFSNSAANAASMIFGVFYWERTFDKNVKEGIANGELRKELDRSSLSKQKSSPNWDWYGNLDKLDKRKYAGWYHEDVIRSMAANDGKQMVDDLFPLLKTAIGIAEKYIDEEVASPC
jgi:hypothetical protein